MNESENLLKEQEEKSSEQVECLNCGGKGSIWLSTYTGAWDMDICPDCLGTGKVAAASKHAEVGDDNS